MEDFKKKLSEALNEASLFLEHNNHDPALARHYWMILFDWSLTDLVLQLDQEISESQWREYQLVLNRIINDEPIQYIMGYADFMDERFKVTRDTLIPREETAGLIELASEYLRHKAHARVLDIGTGSGIIAIILAKRFPKAEIIAVDISQAALDVAQENADNHQVQINFLKSDLFSELNSEYFDLIVSNPPYIAYNEIELMDASVMKYEPQQALFASNKGLDIYKAISNQVIKHLRSDWQILFEIGFAQGLEVKNIYNQTFPQAEIDIIKDFNDKDRYIRVNRMKEGES